MNIKFPSASETQSALQAEYYVIDNLSLVQQYLKSISFNSEGGMVLTGFALYEYEDKDLDEVIYMCVEFNFDVEDERTNEKSTMLLCGIGTDNRKIDRLQHVLSKL